MTSPGGVITEGDILLDEWLDLTTSDEPPCHADSNAAVFNMIHTIDCGHADPPLPHCLKHYDLVQKNIEKAQGTIFANYVICRECKAHGRFVRWEPVR